MTQELKVGMIYPATVVSLKDFGAFCEIAGTGQDFAYMHMQRRGRPKKGARVHTGEQIGWVGHTGDATACHLHFEMWVAGWRTSSGYPIDPLPYLLAWDHTGAGG